MSELRPLPIHERLLTDPQALLIGQSVSLGVLLAFVIVGGNTLFLAIYGPEALPYVFIVVAVLGSGLFYGMAAVQNRFPLVTVLIATLILGFLYYMLTWIGLVTAGWNWLAFGLIMSFSLMLQLGFVVLEGQAGRLYNVQVIKRVFPRITAGFVVGFLIGGALAPLIVGLRGQTADLVLGSAAANLGMLIFLLLVIRQFPEPLARESASGRPRQAKPLRRLLLNRFVLFVVAYQFLSAMATQLVNYIFLDQSAARFATEAGLATFFSGFTVAINAIDLIFLLFVAGWFLVKFGLRLGLLANPLVNLALLAAQLVIGLMLGTGSTLFFWLVMAAWVGDVAFTDGTTRGSINTAYQAVAVEDRAVIQTGVEGIGYPLALGLSGIILLIFNAIPGLTILPVTTFAIGVMALWVWTGVIAYRHYGQELTKALKRRALNLNELFLDDQTIRQLLTPLLMSEKPRDIQTGLELLANNPDRRYNSQLIALLEHPDKEVTLSVLRILESRRIKSAAPAVKEYIKEVIDPDIRGAALRVIGVLDQSAAPALCRPYLADPAQRIRSGALAGFLRAGGMNGGSDILQTFVESEDLKDRIAAAQAMGVLGWDVDIRLWLPLLRVLLKDDSVAVRTEALFAAGRAGHPALIPNIWVCHGQRGTRSAATSALIQMGDALLPEASRILNQGDHPQAEVIARVCSQIKSEAALALLREQITHPSGRIRSYILAALAKNSGRTVPADRIQVLALLGQEHASARFVLNARADLLRQPGTDLLVTALEDEFRLILERMGYLCALMGDAQAILLALSRLRQGDNDRSALAFEFLEVTLPAEVMGLAGALLDPRLSLDQRTQKLQGDGATEVFPDERIIEIAGGKSGFDLMAWTRACAIFVGSKIGLKGEFVPLLEKALYDSAYEVREAAVAGLAQVDPDLFVAHAADLRGDGDRRMARLTRMLAIEYGL